MNTYITRSVSDSQISHSTDRKLPGQSISRLLTQITLFTTPENVSKTNPTISTFAFPQLSNDFRYSTSCFTVFSGLMFLQLALFINIITSLHPIHLQESEIGNTNSTIAPNSSPWRSISGCFVFDLSWNSDSE